MTLTLKQGECTFSQRFYSINKLAEVNTSIYRLKHRAIRDNDMGFVQIHNCLYMVLLSNRLVIINFSMTNLRVNRFTNTCN